VVAGRAAYLEIVRALGTAQVTVYDEQDFRRLVNTKPSLAAEALVDTSHAFCSAARREQFHLENLEARLAALILSYARLFGRRSPQQVVVRLRLTQAQIAGALGASDRQIRRLLQQWRDQAWLVFDRGQPVLQDPVCRDRLVQLIMEEKSLGLAERRTAVPDLNTDYPGSLPLSHKLRLSEYQRRMRQYALELQGGLGGLYVGDEEAIAGGFWQRAYFNNFATTIGGGTSQIQSNIIGEHVLGLPKS